MHFNSLIPCIVFYLFILCMQFHFRNDDNTRNNCLRTYNSLCYNWISGNDPLSSHHHRLSAKYVTAPATPERALRVIF